MRLTVRTAVPIVCVALVCGVAGQTRPTQAKPPQTKPATPAPPPAPALPPPITSAAGSMIAFEQYSLPNGLTVILSPDHTTPTVAVDVWYHVGSKNEETGRTGFAHLFEHVMFTGSGHAAYPKFDDLTGGIGGSNNGTTSTDRTEYYETVPAHYLESTLWLEADRMGFLLDVLDVKKLNAQRDVVKNERRQNLENPPYGRADELMSNAMYPADHPYSWDTYGSMADLSAASTDDVKTFFRTYYSPGNAILTIVGDVTPATAKAWVARYFATIPRGTPITRPTVAPPVLTAESRLVYEDRVQIPRLYVQWPSAGERSDDRFALNVLASILAGSRTTRLTKALVYGEQSAASVSARQETLEDGGSFRISITPRPGHSLTDLETAADAILDAIKKDAPAAEEIQRVTAGAETAFVLGLQSNLGKAQRLADASGFHNDPGYFQTVYRKLQAVTPADVKRVASKYLTAGRVVLSIVPTGKLELAARPADSRKVK